MLSYVKRHFAGPNIYTDVLDYVRTCPECQKAKPRNARPFGTILPLQPPEASWQDISMDLITSLPTSDNYDAIFVIVDRFSKMAHFIPTNTTADAPTLATLFINNIVRIHGIPRSIISDRDPRFISTFWRELFRTTPNHTPFLYSQSSTNRRTNRTNKPHTQAIYTTICESQTTRMEQISCTCRNRLQLQHPFSNRFFTFLHRVQPTSLFTT